ncbi:MAG: Uma2 family endonuclease [Planctomycetota bacterium]|jgi:Uma2 family endonuclease|nr:Uma2 family endonuclease [Planctomycetota bacterium]
MSVATVESPPIETLEELIDRLGSVGLDRIRLVPPPGTATKQDVLDVHDKTNRLFELVDGVLVEKAMGFYESRIANALIGIVEGFLRQNDIGITVGADGMMQLAPGLVRMPDVAFLSWDKFPNREIPEDPIPELAPDLAVEVLSLSNTRAETERKTREFFEAGVRLVWIMDPRKKMVDVYTSPDEFKTLHEDDSLDGGDVLPGFALPIQEWFERAGKWGGH